MERAEIAIVGAGITGLSIAWHAIERGLTGVALYEKAGVGAGASGVQPGGVRQQWSTAVNCELARDSLAFYRDVGERLGARVDLRFDACGYVFLAHSQQELERLAAAVDVQHSVGVPSRLLSPAEAAEHVPGLNAEGIVGAGFCAEDGYFERPQGVVEAFGEAVARGGGELRTAKVIGLDDGASGWTLRLADGEKARADRVIVAAGYDTPLLLATTGISVPIEREERYLFYSDPIRERLLEPLVVSSERQFAAKQLANGRVLASHLRATGDPAQDGGSWRRHVRSCILELLPRLEYVSLPLLVPGLYDVTPDNQAIVGEVPGRPGLWVAAGFSGHGFMIAPEVGRAVAAQLCGEDPGARFAEVAGDAVGPDRVGLAGQRGQVLHQRPAEQLPVRQGHLLLHEPGDLQQPGVGIDDGHVQGGVDPVELGGGRHVRAESGDPQVGPGRRRRSRLGRHRQLDLGPRLRPPAGCRRAGPRRRWWRPPRLRRRSRWCAGTYGAAPPPAATGRSRLAWTTPRTVRWADVAESAVGSGRQ